MAEAEELWSRQAPHSLEAEQSVLGAMLIDSRCVPDVIGLLKPEDFYLQQNREIYETIYTMFHFSQVIDPVTVLDKMQERGVWQETSTEYIKQLMEITPTSANAARYAAIVRDKALLRALATAASEISETVYEGVGTPSEILPPHGAGPVRQRDPGAFHGPGGPGPEDQRTQPVGFAPHCRPARHGEDLLRFEYRPARGQKVPADRGVFLSGDVPGAAGHAAAVRRELCGQPENGHGQALR